MSATLQTLRGLQHEHVTLAQLAVFVALADTDGDGLSMDEVAALSGLTSTQIFKLAPRFAKAGLLVIQRGHRGCAAGGKRNPTRLRLTNEGKAFARSIQLPAWPDL